MNTEHYKFKGEGLSGNERRQAKSRFSDYRKHYHISNFSDLQLLEELVYRETMQELFKKELAEPVKDESKTKPIKSRSIQNNLNDNLQQILILKEKLGLFEEKKEEKDVFTHIQNLKQKFDKWCEENQGSRSLICPHCGKMILLKIRTEAWEAQKHPFFRDRILTNDHLMKLHKEGKISKEDFAKVLGVSPDYIEFLLDKYYSK